MQLSQTKKIFLIWFLVMVILSVLNRVGEIVAPWQGYIVLLNALILMYVPIVASWKSGERIRYLDWEWSKALANGLILFLVCSLVFVPYLFLNHFYQGIFFNRTWQELHLAGVATYFFNQLILVALPEEIFFRGFLEDGLTRIFVPRRQVFGAPFGVAMILGAIIFAFSHSLIAVQWWHFSIIFPALLFSWFRQKTGSIWVGAVFHALCNVLAWVIGQSYG